MNSFDMISYCAANFDATPAGSSFPLAIAQADPEENAVLEVFEHEYTGRSQDGSVIIKYLYQRCQAFDRLKLPKGKTYRVEVIDTWNMTRTTVYEKTSGMIKVDLPGRPYMAILATEI